MSTPGYRRISQKYSNPNRSLKLLAQSGYYFVIAFAVLGAFIEEATGNVKKASLASDDLISAAATSCQIPSAKTQKKDFSCAPELASVAFFNWYPPMDFRKPFTEPNSSKQKGESHDYN